MTKKYNALAESFRVKEVEVDGILAALDAKRWLGGETIEAIVYAGPIDDSGKNFIAGHNGFFIATDEYVCHVTNGDPVWAEWSEDTANDINVEWGDITESLSDYKI